jgi:adenosylcobinamide-GDP ribazoletransferase
LGSYGVLALLFALALKVACLHALVSQSTVLGAAALMSAAVISRTGAITLMLALPAARKDGAAAAVGRPSRASVLGALVVAFVAALALLAVAHGLAGLPLAIILAGLATLSAAALSRRMLGGQTGDVIGATQQVTEIAFLIGLTISLSQRH